MHADDIQFHNVGALVPVDGGGRLIQRVPEAVRTELNEGARSRVRHPAGVELRFVPEESVELTLSVRPGGSADSETVRVFWGPIQGYDEFEIGAEPRTVEVSMPEKLRRLKPSAMADLPFDPRVCRVCLPGEHRSGYTRYHGAEGARRPPTEDEVPDRRYLAYGTSITEGEAALGEHLTYVNQTARRLGADLLNLGSCGTAYCDAAMADHIAARDDWDVVTLSVSVNMVGRFSPETFRERAEYLVDTVASAHPERPVVCITVFRNSRDVVDGHEEAETCERFRAELRDVVAASPHDNVYLLEGPALLPSVDGLTTDLVHPGDGAMTTMAERLADELAPLLED
ncbi:SGNH/GDSL hydrolase family protein [Halosolutus gelatinilyticus]|uniref:SGNH/GDSL hydrolase family protein n=1 Tax=Halosolutus gelatinilyticus TaxID=2931975 RepID=UPI001FF15771|nr:SGNH/GDSL hydrolase family protein [Halosolutus gelatinilyticus]